MSYQEQYKKLIEELKELEEKREELQEQLLKIRSEENKISFEYRRIEAELDDLKRKKDTMLLTKKIDRLSFVFSSLTALVPILTMCLIALLNIFFKSNLLQFYTSLLSIGIPISVVNAFAALHIGKKLVQKERKKIKNSEEYQKLLDEIKTKEKDKKITNDTLQEISRKVELVLSDFNVIKSQAEVKEAEIEDFKDKVFYSVVDAPIQSEEKTRPYTKVRRIETK